MQQSCVLNKNSYYCNIIALMHMAFKTTTTKFTSDIVGIISSSLCFIHCFITPVLFMSQLCSVSCCDTSPIWWKFIDFSFLVISFIAILYSTRYTGKAWIKPLFWAAWLLQLTTIVNENMQWMLLPEWTHYLPALALVALHAYNKKYCRCAYANTMHGSTRTLLKYCEHGQQS